MLERNKGRNVCHIGQFEVIFPVTAIKDGKRGSECP
jgi:hypothetical protein